MSGPFVESLHIHPVKSTAVQSVSVMDLTANGADGDRRYMLVDDDGGAITARDTPRLVLARVALEEKGLMLSAPGMAPLGVEGSGQQRGPVTLWNTSVEGAEQLGEASAWFSKYLDRPCHLVHATSATRRKAKGMKVPDAFQDSAPLMVATSAALDELNQRLDEPVTMAHFRPNIVIGGAPAFDEDCWARVRIGDVILAGLFGCGRCVFTTIDPLTADKRDKGEPLRTLNEYRKGNDNQVYFGQHVRVLEPGQIKVGDAVEVLERLPGLKSLGDFITEAQEAAAKGPAAP